MSETPTLSRVTRIHEVTDERIKRLIESGFIPLEKISKYHGGTRGDAEMIDYLVEQVEEYARIKKLYDVLGYSMEPSEISSRMIS